MVIVNNPDQKSVGYWYEVNSAQMSTAMTRLSSGLKINTPQDDPAGDALNMNTQNYIAGLTQATSSEQNAITYLNNLNAWYQNVSSTLDQMQQVSVRIDDPQLSTQDKYNLATQFNDLANEVNNIMTGSVFNNMSMFGLPQVSQGTVAASTPGTGNQGPFTQTRIVAMDGIGTTIAMNAKGGLGPQADFQTIGISTLIALTVATAMGSGATIGQTLATLSPIVSNSVAMIGAYEVEIQAAYSNNEQNITNMQAVSSNISSTDIAQESQVLAQYQILTQSDMAMMTQVNTSMLNVLQLLR